MPGIFITFEGIEGVGKSTLQMAMAEALRLKEFDVLVTREPGGTPLGENLRQAILSQDHVVVDPVTELLIMFAARAQHVTQCIQPALAEKKIVLCDRFSDTSRAYQGGGRGLPMQYIEELVLMTHPTTHPTLTFWLDLPVAQALSRVGKRAMAFDRIEQEKIDFFERARAVYAQLALTEPQRIIRLDAALNPDELLQQALKVFFNQFADQIR
jgi:dTMP kinase